MTQLKAGLDPLRFVSVHRGTLVRLDCVREVIPATHGEYDVVLKDGTTFKLSRRFRSRLLPLGVSARSWHSDNPRPILA